MHLRPARPSDRSYISELLDRAGLPISDLDDHPIDAFTVALAGDAIVGCVGAERHDEALLLRSLAVGEAFRGRGIGAALVRAVENHAADGGAMAIYLLTETARDFFLRHGYELIDREAAPSGIRASTEFTSLCPSSAICMRKQIATAPAAQ